MRYMVDYRLTSFDFSQSIDSAFFYMTHVYMTFSSYEISCFCFKNLAPPDKMSISSRTRLVVMRGCGTQLIIRNFRETNSSVSLQYPRAFKKSRDVRYNIPTKLTDS